VVPMMVALPEPQRSDVAPSERPRVQTAARCVSILVAVARSSQGLLAKEIAEQLGLPRQVTYHLLHTLSGTGIVRKNGQGRYVAGMTMATLVDGFMRQLDAPGWFAPVVRQVAQDTGETAYAVGWMDGEIVVLSSARGVAAVHAAEVPHGFSGHAHARASGKVLLALAPPLQCAEYLRGHRFTRLTPHTIAGAAQLRAELERIRVDGYALDREEFALGLRCIAVPMAASPAFAIGLSAPAERFELRFEHYLKVLRRYAGHDTDASGPDESVCSRSSTPQIWHHTCHARCSLRSDRLARDGVLPRL
jgi:IclR family acetate operon transcriptional repressor